MADDIGALAARAIAIAEKAASTQDAIVAQQRKSKRTVRLLAVSVILDIMLSVATITLAVNQQNVSRAIHDSQLAACAIGNETRAAQVQLWDHVIGISRPPPGETGAERKARLARLAALRAYVRNTFRQINCAALYGK